MKVGGIINDVCIDTCVLYCLLLILKYEQHYSAPFFSKQHFHTEKTVYDNEIDSFIKSKALKIKFKRFTLSTLGDEIQTKYYESDKLDNNMKNFFDELRKVYRDDFFNSYYNELKNNGIYVHDLESFINDCYCGKTVYDNILPNRKEYPLQDGLLINLIKLIAQDTDKIFQYNASGKKNVGEHILYVLAILLNATDFVTIDYRVCDSIYEKFNVPENEKRGTSSYPWSVGTKGFATYLEEVLNGHNKELIAYLIISRHFLKTFQGKDHYEIRKINALLDHYEKV
ncbi:hypothetical protein [Methanococcus maripaludis]|uniref:Uncharacterized protein n=1 Tax=Methanococcus maripaludis TaxID=39152 RepID=A0A2L1C9A6_METMI|nr:hypothetical protein [Methanococcus maripaludis]AVB75927.1 hypothetical protein MMJJ_05100 [Methanococcus maripaludis]MBB6497864.1 hypothetical protein [Methanococcus maripaludis]